MTKRNKILAISSSFLMLSSLAACGVSATPKDNILLEFSDESVVVKADDVFNKYLNSKDGVEAAYEEINNAVARYTIYNSNYDAKRSELIAEAKADVDDVKADAESKADTNKTSYEDELKTLLKSHGAEDLKELQIIFENQKFRSYLQEDFYDKFIDQLKIGGNITDNIQVDSYINDILPYHVKHILVKVSASSSNYTTSTITESEATKLVNVINTLGTNTVTNFGVKAKNLSDDTASANDYGDLGLMSINTSYVNEFKLGIYTYDTLFNSEINLSDGDVENKVNNFLLNDDEDTAEYKEYLEEHGLNFIPSGITGQLDAVKDVTLDDNNEKVNDGKDQYYPRNVLWNKFLNKHEVSFIEYADVVIENDEYVAKPINVTDADLDAHGFVAGTNYAKVDFKNPDNPSVVESHYVLTDGNRENPKPILVTRAGTGDGESGYQGIHFIVVERNALKNTENGVTLDQYYTTKLPGVNGQYDDEELKGKRVYVNAFDDTQKAYQSRVDSLIQEIKEADNSIEKKINQYYFELSGATIKDQTLKNKLDIYYDADLVSEDENSHSELVSKWQEYVRVLQRQNEETASKLIPSVCAINFTKASSDEEYKDGQTYKDLYDVGGICHYVEQKA